MRVCDLETGSLGEEEDAARNDETPETAHAEILDKKIASDSTEQAPEERKDADNADVHELSLHDELGGRAGIRVPKGLHIVADIVDGYETDARKDTEHEPERVELWLAQEGKARDVWTVV